MWFVAVGHRVVRHSIVGGNSLALIRLEGLSVFGHHGARPYEKEAGQRLEVDLELEPTDDRAEKSDRLADAPAGDAAAARLLALRHRADGRGRSAQLPERRRPDRHRADRAPAPLEPAADREAAGPRTHAALRAPHDRSRSPALRQPDRRGAGPDRSAPGADPPLVRAGTAGRARSAARAYRSEEHTSELQSRGHLVCRLLLEKKKQ